MDTDNLSIIIPAAGFGHRLMSKKPKALISINGTTILDRQLSILSSTFPKAEITLIVGFEAERIIKNVPSNIKIIKNSKFRTTNVAHSLQMGLRQTKYDNVLIVYGDLIFQKDLFTRFNCAEPYLLYDNKSHLKNEEVGMISTKGETVLLDYGFKSKWCQIAYLTKQAKASFLDQHDSDRLFGFEIINKTIQTGIKYKAISPNGIIISEIDSLKDVAVARKLINENSL